MYQHGLKSVNEEAACCRNPNKPSCIDLILTISPGSFFDTEIYFTGPLDCYKLVWFIFKTMFPKIGPKDMMYWDFKNFSQEIFGQKLYKNIS